MNSCDLSNQRVYANTSSNGNPQRSFRSVAWPENRAETQRNKLLPRAPEINRPSAVTLQHSHPSSSHAALRNASVRREILTQPHLDVSTRFGSQLRRLRSERGMTQMGMAKKFGIDRSFISEVERGKKSLSLSMLEVIALGLKVSLSELLKGL